MTAERDYRAELIAHLDKRKTSPRVRERILRLNPTPHPSEILRGWHPGATAWRESMWRCLASKGWVIRRYGRAAWDSIPRRAIYKIGRRQYAGALHFMEAVGLV